MSSCLEWIGAVSGATGALLLAANRSWSRWGFVAFLVSNVCWIAFGVSTAAPGLVAMQVVMTGTSLLGIHRWIGFGRPVARGRQQEAAGE